MTELAGDFHLGTMSSTCLMKRCILYTIFLLLIADLSYTSVIHRIRAGCELITNEDWSKTQALILNENMTKIIHPEYEDSVLLTPTEKIVLACPGSHLVMKEETETVASCKRGTEVQVDEENYEFNTMSCEKLPQTSARVVGSCLEETVNGIKIEIGFNVETNFIKLIDICFDDRMLSTLYSHYVATPKIVGRQHGFRRPQFRSAGFYHGIQISKLYSRNEQRETISEILGSTDLGDKYIRNDSLHYLARGHLSAKADFIYGSEQMGTFYYVNVAPQWQIINAGNWEELEDSVRKHVADTGLEISVYTLPYEVAILPDIDEKLKKLYIYHSEIKEDSDDDDYYDNTDNEKHVKNLVPVPKFYIKILYHEKTKKGVAFITVNNPYLKEITPDYILCDDICDKYPWLTWNQTDVQLGYSYCCPYEDLKNIVNTLPDIPIENLL